MILSLLLSIFDHTISEKKYFIKVLTSLHVWRKTQRGTWNSSADNFAPTLSFTYIRYKSCSMATLEHLKPFQPVNYTRIVAFLPAMIYPWGSSSVSKPSPCATAPPRSLYHWTHTYGIWFRASEPHNDDRKSLLTLCLLSSVKVATTVSTSHQYATCKLVATTPQRYESAYAREYEDPTPKHSADDYPTLILPLSLAPVIITWFWSGPVTCIAKRTHNGERAPAVPSWA